jgi:hypothetical protein
MATFFLTPDHNTVPRSNDIENIEGNCSRILGGCESDTSSMKALTQLQSLNTPITISSPIISKIENEPEMSSSEKRQRELEESERLCWQLMQEESMRAYEMQVEYMRAHPELFGEEDLSALQDVLNEGNDIEDDIDEEGDEQAVDTSDPDTWSYDRLLELGNIIGGLFIIMNYIILQCIYS